MEQEVRTFRAEVAGSAPAENTPAQQISPQAPPSSGFQPFDIRNSIPPGNNNNAFWLRFEPGAQGWQSSHFAILLSSPPSVTVSAFHGNELTTTDGLYALGRSPSVLHSGLGFGFHVSVGSHDPIYLYMPPTAVNLVAMEVYAGDFDEINRLDIRRFAFQVACEVVLFLTSLTALMSSILIKDRAYAYYTGFVSFYAAWHAVLNGLANFPDRWFPQSWDPIWVAYTFQCIFVAFVPVLTIEFCEIKKYTPGVVSFARLGVWAPPLMWFFNVCNHKLVHWHPVKLLRYASISASVFFAVVFLSLLVAVWLSWRRGSNYAGLFALGWLPWFAGAIYGTFYPVFGRGLGPWTLNCDLATLTWAALTLSYGLAFRTRRLYREHDRLLWLSEIDPLTGLLNRRSFDARLEVLLSEATRTRRSLCLLFLDLDHFKKVNDSYGHACGDEALRHCAQVLQKGLRRTDLLARYGGEEFVLALPGTEGNDARAVAEALRNSIATKPCRVMEQKVNLTISIGFATWQPGEAATDLRERADRAMYRAKSEGRNRVVGAEDAVVMELPMGGA